MVDPTTIPTVEDGGEEKLDVVELGELEKARETRRRRCRQRSLRSVRARRSERFWSDWTHELMVHTRGRACSLEDRLRM